MFTTLIISAILILAIYVIVKNAKKSREITTEVKFVTNTGRKLKGYLRQGTSGKNRSDWHFYDEDDSLILDLLIIDYLFDVIINHEGEDDATFLIADDYGLDEDLLNIDATTPYYTPAEDYVEVVEDPVVEQVAVTSEPEVEEAVVMSEPEVEEPVFMSEPVYEDVEETIKTSSYSNDSYDSSDYGSSDYGSSDY